MNYNRDIARENTPSERAGETHSPSRQDAKRTHAPGQTIQIGGISMSINEMDGKIKELRELRRMAEELTAEIDSIQDSIKAHMDAE